MKEIAKFGTAGVPNNYRIPPFNDKRKYFFEWLKDLGLNAFEVQCTYGFQNSGFSEEELLKAKPLGISLTIHAPFYVNLGSLKEDVVDKSINNLIFGVEMAKSIGATRIIFHPGGGYGKGYEARKVGIEKIIKALNYIETKVDMGDIRFYPEVSGKISGLGSLDEIIEICKNVKCAEPCIDFAHLNARELGSLKCKNDFIAVLDKIEKELGRESLERMHVHCYNAAFSSKGELYHFKFGEISEQFPNPNLFLDNFIEAMKEKKVLPWVVSEASGTQDLGAVYLKEKYYE